MTRSNTTTCPFCPSWEHSPSTDIAVVQIFSYQVNNSGTSTNGSSTSRSANLLAESGYLIGHRGPTANEQKRQKLLLAQQQLLANAKTQETARLRGCALYLSRLLKPFWSSLVLTQIPLPKEALLLSRSSGGTGLKRNREGQLISGSSKGGSVLPQFRSNFAKAERMFLEARLVQLNSFLKKVVYGVNVEWLAGEFESFAGLSALLDRAIAVLKFLGLLEAAMGAANAELRSWTTSGGGFANASGRVERVDLTALACTTFAELVLAESGPKTFADGSEKALRAILQRFPNFLPVSSVAEVAPHLLSRSEAEVLQACLMLDKVAKEQRVTELGGLGAAALGGGALSGGMAGGVGLLGGSAVSSRTEMMLGGGLVGPGPSFGGNNPSSSTALVPFQHGTVVDHSPHRTTPHPQSSHHTLGTFRNAVENLRNNIDLVQLPIVGEKLRICGGIKALIDLTLLKARRLATYGGAVFSVGPQQQHFPHSVVPATAAQAQLGAIVPVQQYNATGGPTAHDLLDSLDPRSDFRFHERNMLYQPLYNILSELLAIGAEVPGGLSGLPNAVSNGANGPPGGRNSGVQNGLGSLGGGGMGEDELFPRMMDTHLAFRKLVDLLRHVMGTEDRVFQCGIFKMLQQNWGVAIEK